MEKVLSGLIHFARCTNILNDSFFLIHREKRWQIYILNSYYHHIHFYVKTCVKYLTKGSQYSTPLNIVHKLKENACISYKH